MPSVITAFKCPYCNDVYQSEEEAADCARNFCPAESPGLVEAFACSRCGKVFRAEAKAREHEASCTEYVLEEPSGEETCLTCANADAEGHRWLPCRDYHFAKIRPACELYAFAPN